MKRIYLLMIVLVAISSNAFAQPRNVDLGIKHYVQQAGTKTVAIHLMVDLLDTIFYNDNSTHLFKAEYRFVVNIKNYGPDALINTDTILVRGFRNSFRGYLTGGATGGIAVGDSVFFDDPDVPESLGVNSAITTALIQTVTWCDTIMAAYMAGETSTTSTITDPVSMNDMTCNEIVQVAWPTSVGEMEVVPNEILLYPNPATNRLDIRYNFVKSATDVTIVVTNAAGQVVISENVSGNFNQTSTIPLNVSQLAGGLYFVNLSADNGDAVTTKFSINR